MKVAVGLLSLLLAGLAGPSATLAVVSGPAIHVEKLINDQADTETDCPIVEAGSVVSLTFYVSNAGTVALSSVGLIDVPGGAPLPILNLGFNVGDRNRNTLLDLGEIWQYTAETIAPVGAQRDLATASGSAGTTTVTDDDPGCYVGTGAAADTVLTYSGATTGDFSDPATVAATLVEASGSAPVVGVLITFSLDAAETCEGTTDSTGLASCAITPAEPTGTYPLIVSFAGDDADLAATTTTEFTVSPDETALAVASIPFVATGQPATMSATLTDPAEGAESEAANPIAGKTISFTLGLGASAQTCVGVTDGSGTASCTVASVDQAQASLGASAVFAGDGFHQPASASTTTTAFSFLARGAFVVGDLSAIPNATVTWWSPAWSSANALSGGATPASFKGFATTLTSVAGGGGTWCTSGGSSGGPPLAVPAYLAVMVADRVGKTGSTISGSVAGVAIVRVNPGYDPTSGGAGTGVLIGFLP